jgi:hypothetical protein
MGTLLAKLAIVLSTIGAGFGALLGGAPAAEPLALGATVPTAVAIFQTSLASSILSTDTSMTLVSATDADGNTLSGTYAFTLDEGTASQEFVVGSCTGTSCTGLTRGLSVTTGTTSVTANKKPHRRGASVKITDAPQLLIVSNILRGIDTLPAKLTYASAPSFATTSNDLASTAWVNSQFVDASADETVSGSKTFTASTTLNGLANIGGNLWAGGTLTVGSTLGVGGTTTLSAGRVVGLAEPYSPDHAATKNYVDGVAVAGAPDADSVTKGIVEEATSAETVAGTAAGGTGARLYVNPSTLEAGIASKMVAYSTSTVAASTGKYQLSVDADDIVLMWGSATNNTGPNANYTFNLKVKQSTFAATTTVNTATDSSGAVGGGEAAASVQGVFTATTTQTLNIVVDGGTSNALTVLHLKQ